MPRDRASMNSPLLTSMQALLANDADEVDALFNVLTRPMDTTSINQVRVNYWLEAASVKVQPAVQFSDNGIDWGAPETIQAQAFASTLGWVEANQWQALFDLAGVKQWCRFGLNAIRLTGGSSEVRSGVAALSIDVRRVPHRTLRASWARLQSDGTTTALFSPVMEPVAVESFKELRATLEYGANTGNIEIQPAYRVTDTPEDWSSWSAATAFGSNVAAEGMSFGTDFDGVTFTGSFAQFGFNVKNGSTGSHEICRATLRVDLRGCPS